MYPTILGVSAGIVGGGLGYLATTCQTCARPAKTETTQQRLAQEKQAALSLSFKEKGWKLLGSLCKKTGVVVSTAGSAIALFSLRTVKPKEGVSYFDRPYATSYNGMFKGSCLLFGGQLAIRAGQLCDNQAMKRVHQLTAQYMGSLEGLFETLRSVLQGKSYIELSETEKSAYASYQAKVFQSLCSNLSIQRLEQICNFLLQRTAEYYTPDALNPDALRKDGNFLASEPDSELKSNNSKAEFDRILELLLNGREYAVITFEEKALYDAIEKLKHHFYPSEQKKF
ncbi:MAG TPA: hypothetical protein VN457_03860 [Chlamydiales bacterium]|nr:hypothetical protein [Chlamydiales bacterium]